MTHETPAWHSLSSAETLKRLGGGAHGLSPEEAVSRLSGHGENTVEITHRVAAAPDGENEPSLPSG